MNMACIVAGNSASAIGSCKSPSIHDSGIEIRAASPWNHGFQTPNMSRVDQASFLGSRLSSVLIVRDKNLPRNENGKSFIKTVEQREVSPCVNVSEENGPLASKCPSPRLKSKRTQRLDISALKSPSLDSCCVTVHQRKEVNVEGFHYAISGKQGSREFMEDTHTAIVKVHGDSKRAFFGVFDGHGGPKAATFAAENIGQNIVDAILRMKPETDYNLEEAVKAGYLKTDAQFLKQEVSSGTACVTALIIDGYLVVSNAGDCRAVISRDGASEALTCDHRAGRVEERQRIENLGGIVDIRHGVWRVQGSLAVTRAIGDSHMKEWITAEPDTRKIQITSDCEFLILASDGLWDKVIQITSDCEFLILASDGLWDKVSNQEAVDIARPFCIEKQSNLTPFRGGPKAACKKLAELAVSRKSQDDVSVMIVQLGHFRMNSNKTG